MQVSSALHLESPAQCVVDYCAVMTTIDPKYSIDIRDGVPVIVNSLTGAAIPDDEPLILFRGRDRNALRMLQEYRRLCVEDRCTPEHIAGIDNRIEAFVMFRQEHPDRMKQPGAPSKPERPKAADNLNV